MADPARTAYPPFLIRGTPMAKHVVDWLMAQSAWFEVLPLPEDNYEITVRVDMAPQLIQTFKSARPANAVQSDQSKP